MTDREPERFYFEVAGNSDNAVTVSVNPNGLTIAVSAEHAVDSYNSTFECPIDLPMAQALNLREFLIRNLPSTED